MIVQQYVRTYNLGAYGHYLSNDPTKLSCHGFKLSFM
jgi:hypothetical protein